MGSNMNNEKCAKEHRAANIMVPILVAVLAFAGSMLGVFLSNLSSQKMRRQDQLSSAYGELTAAGAHRAELAYSNLVGAPQKQARQWDNAFWDSYFKVMLVAPDGVLNDLASYGASVSYMTDVTNFSKDEADKRLEALTCGRLAVSQDRANSAVSAVRDALGRTNNDAALAARELNSALVGSMRNSLDLGR